MSDSPYKRIDPPPTRHGTQRGPVFWKSLDELADSAEFRRFLEREFPSLADDWNGAFDRRAFLKVMAASMALAGLGGCGREPFETIVPYVKAPPEQVPGHPMFYATAMPRDGFGSGVLVENNMGRPIKLEGNPNHPASRGATDAIAQASILQLWDPERARIVRHHQGIGTWDAFLGELQQRLAAAASDQGAGIRLLTGSITSPTLQQQLERFLQQYPQARWHQYQPINLDNALQGATLAYGEPALPLYRFERAEVVVTLDSDFLSFPPERLRYARDLMGRRAMPDADKPNRLYALETVPTLSGAIADHRWPLKRNRLHQAVFHLAAALGVIDDTPDAANPLAAAAFAALVDDLQRHRGSALIVAGERQPPQIHALAHAMNHALGNLGHTVELLPPVLPNTTPQLDSLRALSADMHAGKVDMLIVLGGNPVYNAPVDLAFARAMAKVPFTTHLSLYRDETSALATWHIPKSHYLESWSDIRAMDGTITIQQPLIAPLYNGHAELELLAAMNGQPRRSAHDVVQSYWRERFGAARFDHQWTQALHRGVVENTAVAPLAPSLRDLDLSAPADTDDGQLDIEFLPDPTVWDGEYANVGWLQELPKPLTKLTWDNAAQLSPATAQRLGVKNEELVELRLGGRRVTAPVWIMPGHADEVISVTLGYGREGLGRVADGAGFNAYRLRDSAHFWGASGVTLRKTGQRYRLASAQHHHSMEGRHIVRKATLHEYRDNPDFAREPPQRSYPFKSIYPEFAYEGYKWGMSINLNACIGCSACVVACQAENNIPVVGKDQVMLARELHWLRIDRYYEGSPSNPKTYFQPVPCMQCEKAPCEPVCPVEASIHDSEGINVQVYNRCIGTRFCSNNCPYKVRRFNFLQYAQDEPALNAQRNPEVTVRMRGVMEKCNYCLQRIANGRIEAEKQDRRIRDGEVITACQAACPSGAIVFGDLNDPHSRVAGLKRHPLDYALLAELNTVPRTTYLAKVENPNPEIEAG